MGLFYFILFFGIWRRQWGRTKEEEEKGKVGGRKEEQERLFAPDHAKVLGKVLNECGEHRIMGTDPLSKCTLDIHIFSL